MKKAISIFLVLLICLASLPISSYAAENSINLKFETEQTGADQVNVKLSTGEIAGVSDNTNLTITIDFEYTAEDILLVTAQGVNNWHIDIPSTLEVIILLFIYSAEISGEIRSYYINIPGWDTVLHTITGFLSAAIGFSLVDIINRNERTKLYLSPLYVAIGAFCFSMTIGVLWEFFEFSMDWFFGLDMQKDTIINTINTVVLDPTRSNKVVTITGITSTAVNGVDLGINGYLDIGLIDKSDSSRR